MKLFEKIILVTTILILITIISYFILFSFAYDYLLELLFGDPKYKGLVKLNRDGLFIVVADPKDFTIVNGQKWPSKATFELNPKMSKTYDEIGVYEKENKPVFIIPLFTENAYAKNGFYDFYNGVCDKSCLTVKINEEIKLTNMASMNAVNILELLGYDSITDIELDKNPNILSKYDKVIVLHNEYVTKNMFDAITSHPNVIYLYPNALYAEISTDYENNTISLIKGHGYPEPEMDNGFDWEFDNTRPYELDTKCDNWKFYDIPNGKMLNCYPEQKIWKDEKILKSLKEE